MKSAAMAGHLLPHVDHDAPDLFDNFGQSCGRRRRTVGDIWLGKLQVAALVGHGVAILVLEHIDKTGKILRRKKERKKEREREREKKKKKKKEKKKKQSRRLRKLRQERQLRQLPWIAAQKLATSLP